MEEKPIIELIEEGLDYGGLELPVFHPIALKLQSLLLKDDYSIKDIAKNIRQDQSLSAQTLKMSNSAYYCGLKPAKTVRDAIVRLGTKCVASQVMLITQKQIYRSQSDDLNRRMSLLWNHALGTAVASRWLATHLGLDKYAEEGFLAGLFHDIGKLLLLKVIENLQESKANHENIPSSLIDDILEAMHCVQGEKLMQHLKMPDIYCQVVAKHNLEEVTEDNIILNLVKLGNLSCHKLGIGPKNDPGVMLSTTHEAINLMADDLILAELQVNLEEYMDSMQRTLEKN